MSKITIKSIKYVQNVPNFPTLMDLHAPVNMDIMLKLLPPQNYPLHVSNAIHHVLLVQDPIKTNVFLAPTFLTYFRMVLVFLSCNIGYFPQVSSSKSQC